MNLQNKKAGLLLQNDGKYPWALALYEEKWSVSTQKFSVPKSPATVKMPLKSVLNITQKTNYFQQ